jgi:hypothetical protein
LGVPPESVVSNIAKYGNTSAASIPLALDEWVRADKVKDGDIVRGPSPLPAVGEGGTGHGHRSSSERLRIVTLAFRVGDELTRPFATPGDSPKQD